MHPVVFSTIINKLKYNVQHNTLMEYHTVLHVSIRMNHYEGTSFYSNLKTHVLLSMQLSCYFDITKFGHLLKEYICLMFIG